MPFFSQLPNFVDFKTSTILMQ